MGGKEGNDGLNDQCMKAFMYLKHMFAPHWFNDEANGMATSAYIGKSTKINRMPSY